MGHVNFDLHTAFSAWQVSPFSIVVFAACVAAAVWYLRADWALAARGRRWSVWRTTPFLGGLAAVVVALCSPVASFTGTYFQAHVIQHLLLMIIAPALLALGAPMTLILQTSGRKAKTRWLKILHSDAFGVLSHPLTVWFLYYGVMVAFFASPLIAVAMEHMWLMDLLNLSFLLAGTLFWWPVVSLDPIPRWHYSHPVRLMILLFGVPLESFLAVSLLTLRAPIAPMYTLSSTHSGAGLFWALTELFTVLAAIPVFFQWMAAEDRKAAREDARLDAEEALAAAQAATVAEAQATVAGQTGRWQPGLN